MAMRMAEEWSGELSRNYGGRNYGSRNYGAEHGDTLERLSVPDAQSASSCQIYGEDIVIIKALISALLGIAAN
jgi:hypothetical protein